MPIGEGSVSSVRLIYLMLQYLKLDATKAPRAEKLPVFLMPVTESPGRPLCSLRILHLPNRML